MILSFDLDDTLIPGMLIFETEKRNAFQRWVGVEQIRTGTIELMKACRAKGHRVYIYTSSLRSVPPNTRLPFISISILTTLLVSRSKGKDLTFRHLYWSLEIGIGLSKFCCLFKANRA